MWAGTSARPLLELSLNVEVDLLVVEAHQILDLRDLGNRPSIGPNEVLVRLVTNSQVPVTGVALVGAVRYGVGRFEQIHAHVELGNVVTRRQAGLKQKHGAVDLSDGLADDRCTNASSTT